MSFKQFKFDVATFQTRGIFNTYVYQTETDTIAQVTSAGYFAASRFPLTDEDDCSAKINACCSDGYVEGFVQADGTLIPINPAENAKVIIDSPASPYTMTGLEDIVLCTGATTFNLISVASSTKDITIQAEGGTVTFAPDGSDTTQASNIVDGNSVTLVGKKSTNEWRAI